MISTLKFLISRYFLWRHYPEHFGFWKSCGPAQLDLNWNLRFSLYSIFFFCRNGTLSVSAIQEKPCWLNIIHRKCVRIESTMVNFNFKVILLLLFCIRSQIFVGHLVHFLCSLFDILIHVQCSFQIISTILHWFSARVNLFCFPSNLCFRALKHFKCRLYPP